MWKWVYETSMFRLFVRRNNGRGIVFVSAQVVVDQQYDLGGEG